MGTFNLEYFLDRKLDLPLNSFKTKANAFCNARPMSLSSCLQNFTLQENRMTAKLSIGWIQSNSKLVSAKHWTYQTLNECINASVMILPIEKFKLLNQAYDVVVKFFVDFFCCKRREWPSNCRQTMLWFCWMTIKLSSLCDPFIVVVFSPKFFAKFFTTTNSKDPLTVDEKNLAKCGANLLAEHWSWAHGTPLSNVIMPLLRVLPTYNGSFTNSTPYWAL